MPKTFDDTGTSDGGSGVFFKLKDGESCLAVLTDEPFMVAYHRLKDGSQFGRQFHCGRDESVGGCPICEKTDEYGPDERRRNSKGFYPLFVRSVTAKEGATTTEVNAHRIMSGGWALIKPFKSAYNNAKEDGESLVSTPIRIERQGADQNTSYTVMPKPKAQVEWDEAEEIDIEAFALGEIKKDQDSLGYLPGGSDGGGESGGDEEVDPFEEQAVSRKKKAA